MEKKAAKVIEGENLDLIIGSIPAEADEKDDVKEKVKANIMKILAKEYDIAVSYTHLDVYKRQTAARRSMKKFIIM